jgi:purine-binding chemotaxis protein CheW
MTNQPKEGAGAGSGSDSGEAQARQLLTFSLGEQLFGVEIHVIKEIIQFGTVTRVPMVPAYIRGVLNLRGAVVPVVDLLARFGNAAAVPGKRACIVIIEVAQQGARQDVGILVDSVSEVLEVDAANIEPPPAFGAGLRADFIQCMARMGSEFVIVLDVDRIFSLEELAQVGEARLAA